jgi:tetraacyldisaccharide 4'-kinase
MVIREDEFRAIVSGRDRRVRARAARALLRAASLGYGSVVRLRNRLYDLQMLRSRRTDATALSIGNLTTGGTGKTPLVVWLYRHVQDKGLRSAILTRGYRTEKGALSDEPALLAAECPETVVVVDPDRVAAAVEAIDRHGAEVLVLDDGFQHRRLARDLDIVAIDATLPFGYGRILPAGLLREPVAGLKRAHAAVLTRCDQVDEVALKEIEERVRRANPSLVIARSVHVPTRVVTADGEEFAPETMRDQRVFAFSGLGNPQAFLRTIERLGGIVADSRAFDDHHRYTTADLDHIREQARDCRAELVLTTQKDWMKIGPFVQAGKALMPAYLAIELRITDGKDPLTSLIDRVLSGRMPRS